jgi:two-component system response regulator (stage 0 sporulation protein A)
VSVSGINNREENIHNMQNIQVTKLMLRLGVPAHLRGYQYLREAIALSAGNMELVGSVTKLLYPEIAKTYKTTDQKVERAIRNAVEVSWQRGDAQLFEEIFGYTRETGRRRPTNSEYIAGLADKVRLDFAG